MTKTKRVFAPRRNSSDVLKKNENPARGEQVVDIEQPKQSMPSIELADLPLPLQEACKRANWADLMPVQKRALPYLLAGRDLMVQSRTGSGKTGTYLLPLMERMSAKVKGVQALVLVPTRELALQVEREAEVLFGGTGLEIVSLYGGVGYGRQLEGLRRGAALVVGTPGRVLDHLLRRSLHLDALQALIFDEADRMLSIGFYQDMKEVQRYLPTHKTQMILFSATYPPHVVKLAKEFMQEPDMLSLSHDQVHVADVQHVFYECKSMDKDRMLLRLIETESPSSAIIFCNTKANVAYVSAVLRGFGLNADELSADLSQAKREEVLARVRKGDLRFLVATDVAARGIDIPELSHVFLYEPPNDRESYIHRAGRTGRAGAAGVVISLVDLMQKMELQRIARFYKINLLALTLPGEGDVAKLVSGRVVNILESRLRLCSSMDKERMARFRDLANELAQDPEQLPLLAMLLDDVYQKALHASPEPIRPSSDFRNKPRRSKNERVRFVPDANRDEHKTDSDQPKAPEQPKKNRDYKSGKSFVPGKSGGPSKSYGPGKSFGAGKKYNSRKSSD